MLQTYSALQLRLNLAEIDISLCCLCLVWREIDGQKKEKEEEKCFLL